MPGKIVLGTGGGICVVGGAGVLPLPPTDKKIYLFIMSFFPHPYRFS